MMMTRRSRLGLIKGLTFAVVWSVLVLHFLMPEPAKVTVHKDQLPEFGAWIDAEAQLALVHDGSQVYALGLACPHDGCLVSVTPRELECPCDGSRFGRRGEVLRGPAKAPLRLLRVRTQGDMYVVQP